MRQDRNFNNAVGIIFIFTSEDDQTLFFVHHGTKPLVKPEPLVSKFTFMSCVVASSWYCTMWCSSMRGCTSASALSVTIDFDFSNPAMQELAS